jgi:hypothetical protein
MTLTRPLDSCETGIATVELVDALVHFEAARIALRCHFEGALDLHLGDQGLSESMPGSVVSGMTRLGAA